MNISQLSYNRRLPLTFSSPNFGWDNCDSQACYEWCLIFWKSGSKYFSKMTRVLMSSRALVCTIMYMLLISVNMLYCSQLWLIRNFKSIVANWWQLLRTLNVLKIKNIIRNNESIFLDMIESLNRSFSLPLISLIFMQSLHINDQIIWNYIVIFFYLPSIMDQGSSLQIELHVKISDQSENRVSPLKTPIN